VARGKERKTKKTGMSSRLGAIGKQERQKFLVYFSGEGGVEEKRKESWGNE